MGFGNTTGLARKVLIAAIAAIGLAGCGQKNSSAPIASRGYGPRTAAAGTGLSVGGYNLQGVVFADPSQQQGFQDAVVGFLSTDVKSGYIGYVSATGQYNSGIHFGGQVAPLTGSLRTMAGGSSQISTNSRFVIQVVDYNPQYPNSPLIPPFVFSNAQGYISGNQAQIVFSDNYGSVTLNGVIDTNSQIFQGTMTYDNSVNIDPNSPGAAGTLGTFQIPLCQFFVCN